MKHIFGSAWFRQPISDCHDLTPPDLFQILSAGLKRAPHEQLIICRRSQYSNRQQSGPPSHRRSCVRFQLCSMSSAAGPAQNEIATGRRTAWSQTVSACTLFSRWTSRGVIDIDSVRRRLGQVVREVLRDDGVSGLWRGTVPTVVR